jgi:hypothetical protein
VLETLGFESDEEHPAADREMRREILAELSSGRISVEEAHRRLRAQETQDNVEDDA